MAQFLLFAEIWQQIESTTRKHYFLPKYHRDGAHLSVNSKYRVYLSELAASFPETYMKTISVEQSKLLILSPTNRESVNLFGQIMAISPRPKPMNRATSVDAYIADAKRDETKRRWLDKILPMIGAGIGLNDKYRKME